MFRRTSRIALKRWQCRKRWVVDCTFKLQVHNVLIQFLKLWLNPCLLKWLSPSLSLGSNLIPNGIWTLYTGAASNGIHFSRLLLYTRWAGLRIFKYSLFYSTVVHGKKENLKYFVLLWYALISSKLRVFYEWYYINDYLRVVVVLGRVGYYMIWSYITCWGVLNIFCISNTLYLVPCKV